MQLSLFLIFPRKLGSTAPLSCCFSSDSTIGKDIEKAKDLARHRREKSLEPGLPDARYGLKPGSWTKSGGLMDRPISSSRQPRKNTMNIMRNALFGESMSSSTSTTYTGTTWASMSHISSSPSGMVNDDLPAVTICSSDNEIDDSDIDVETPLNSPSPHSIVKKTFQFDRIPEIDLLEQTWVENELRRAQSAPEINKPEDE